MFTTNSSQGINFSASDGTVFVSPGAVRLDTYVMDFKGGNIPFSAMTNFGSSTGYQNSVLSFINFNNYPDLTANYSDVTSALVGLGSFYIADTSTTKPLGFFTFKYDGTDINLESSSKVF